MPCLRALQADLRISKIYKREKSKQDKGAKEKSLKRSKARKRKVRRGQKKKRKVGRGHKSKEKIQEFFADLRLPYSVKRGEAFPLNVTLFNYLDVSWM